MKGNKNVVRWLPVVSILLSFWCTSVWADDPPDPSAPVPESGEGAQETVQEGIPREEIVWPKPFKPSEEIGADSQVSFPTDI